MIGTTDFEGGAVKRDQADGGANPGMFGGR